jgi:GH43 family beta-xylosidase
MPLKIKPDSKTYKSSTYFGTWLIQDPPYALGNPTLAWNVMGYYVNYICPAIQSPTPF